MEDASLAFIAIENLRRSLTQDADVLERTSITRWLVMFAARMPLKLYHPRIGDIHYEGVGFQGSPSLVFDRYVNLVIEDLIEKNLRQVEADLSDVDPSELDKVADQASELLTATRSRLRHTAEDVKGRLLGDGFKARPQRVGSGGVEFIPVGPRLEARTRDLRRHTERRNSEGEEKPLSDFFEEFRFRINRRLEDQLREAAVQFGQIDAELAARGLRESGARVKRLMAAVSSQQETAVDFCFGEVERLPGQTAIHRVVALPFLTDELAEHLTKLKAAAHVDELRGLAGDAVTSEEDRLRSNLEADLREFKAGLWRPRHTAPSSAATQNTINIHSSAFNGVIQQAGSGAEQRAEVTLNVPDLRTALDAFRQALDEAGLNEDTREAMLVEIETIAPQLRKPRPDIHIIQRAAGLLRDLAIGVAGGLLTPYATALLAAAGLG